MASLSLQQKSLFEALHNSRAEDFKTFNKKDYRGVWSSIVDKYPESAHFVYELLQNVDDAEASEVYIILRHDRLLFKHNGTKHFDITGEDAENVGDINSITGIGDSSKVDTQNKIGKFGVGFKAVFQYTDVPEIYDDYFKFKIENYIVPTLLPYDHPERKEGETLFVFPVNVKVTVGTVHRFQGGQCKFMFVVLNPPLGIKTASDRIFLNNKNILNVAISRAQDNLCILLPHSDTEGYENLYEINDIGRIAMQSPENVSTYTCDEIEDVIFGQKFYIESNTFVTSHQLANVYTRASKKFEVRIDEKSVDIQLGGEWGI